MNHPATPFAKLRESEGSKNYPGNDGNHEDHQTDIFRLEPCHYEHEQSQGHQPPTKSLALRRGTLFHLKDVHI